MADSFGDDFAAASAARSGHSEHQLGTTVDLGGGAEWLGGNAWSYGFALSYPDGASPQKTCYKPEPWHSRYFGATTAAQIGRATRVGGRRIAFVSMRLLAPFAGSGGQFPATCQSQAPFA